MKNIISVGSHLIALVVLLGVLVLAPITGSPQAEAQSKEDVCRGITGSAGCPESESQVQGVIRAALNIFASIVGIAGVIMIVVGGFKYMTASGDSSKVTSAQHTIIYAIIGLIVAALAQVIVQFVLQNVPD